MKKKIKNLTLNDIKIICDNNCDKCILNNQCDDLKTYITLRDKNFFKNINIVISIKAGNVSNNFHDVAKKYCNGELFLSEASEQCNMCEDTFRKKLKIYNYVKTKRKRYGHRYFINKATFNHVAKKYKNGEYSALECSRLLGISDVTFINYLKECEE